MDAETQNKIKSLKMQERIKRNSDNLIDLTTYDHKKTEIKGSCSESFRHIPQEKGQNLKESSI